MLTAAAASLALIPIAREIFWGPMAYAMMGGIIVGTVLTLLFLPALYVAWFRIKEPESATDNTHENPLAPVSQASHLFNPSADHYSSDIFDLVAGDVIATGTPAGVGFTRKPPVFLKAGDVVEVEIDPQ